MTLLDIILGAILIFGFFRGLKKGLFVTLASLVGLVGGVYVAFHFSDYAAGHISRWFNWNDQTTNIAAYAVTFIIVVFLVSLAGKFLTKIADLAFLGGLNKIFGGIFSMLTYAFILSVVIMLSNSWDIMDTVFPEEKQEESILYPKVASIAPAVLPYIIDEVEEITDPEMEEEARTED